MDEDACAKRSLKVYSDIFVQDCSPQARSKEENGGIYLCGGGEPKSAVVTLVTASLASLRLITRYDKHGQYKRS